jgi:hypothetical protein
MYNNGQYYNSSGTLVNGSLIDPATQFYTGIANNDVEGPAILVACDSATETYFQTRVYRCNVDISTRMMAYDSSTSSNATSSAISFGGNIASLFGNSYNVVAGVNALETGLAVIQAQVMDFKNERIEDAWISNTNINLICLLVNN